MTWCSSAVNLASLSLRATSRTRSSPLGTPGPALRPGRVELSVFPLASPLPSTTSAAADAALFGGFAGTTRLSDFPRSFISGVRPQPSLSGPPGNRPDGRAWDLPVLAHEDSTHAQVLRPRGARRQLAIALPPVLPSADLKASAPRTKILSRLNSPAYVSPYRRFAARPHGRRRMARGHRGSLLLRCRAFSSPSPCRFIPAHQIGSTPSQPLVLVAVDEGDDSCVDRRARSRRKPTQL